MIEYGQCLIPSNPSNPSIASPRSSTAPWYGHIHHGLILTHRDDLHNFRQTVIKHASVTPVVTNKESSPATNGDVTAMLSDITE